MRPDARRDRPRPKARTIPKTFGGVTDKFTSVQQRLEANKRERLVRDLGRVADRYRVSDPGTARLADSWAREVS